MYSNYLFFILIIIDIVFNLTNIKTKKCLKNNEKVLIVLIIHHITSVFLLYGWLLNIKILLVIHIFSVILTIIHWRFNNNRCAITEYVNKKCGWNLDYPFMDLLYFSGIKSKKWWNNIGHYLFIIFGMCISIFKLVS